MGIIRNKMDRHSIWVAWVVLVSLGGCQKPMGRTDPEDFRYARGHGALDTSPQRTHLLELSIKGYAPLANKKTSLDSAVVPVVRAEGEFDCEILSPLAGTQAANKSWAPFDFYTNVTPDVPSSTLAGKLGEKDIFWIGDDLNRNGTDDSHLQTIRPHPSFGACLKFTQREIDPARKWFQFLVTFKRGPMEFKKLLRVRSVRSKTGCSTVALLCDPTEEEGTGRQLCESGWNRRLHQVVATADTSATKAVLNGFRADKDKDDLLSLIGMTSPVDAQGNSLEEPQEEPLAERQE